MGCQYSVREVDLRRLKQADVLIPHHLSLFPRASGIIEGAQENCGGYMNGQYENHARLSQRGGSYGPYPLHERLPNRGPQGSRRPLMRLWR